VLDVVDSTHHIKSIHPSTQIPRAYVVTTGSFP
jgi:hypothetical protein